MKIIYLAGAFFFLYLSCAGALAISWTQIFDPQQTTSTASLMAFIAFMAAAVFTCVMGAVEQEAAGRAKDKEDAESHLKMLRFRPTPVHHSLARNADDDRAA